MSDIDYFAAVDNLVQRPPTLLPELEPYWNRYQSLDMQPLRVEVEIAGVMAGYHPLSLDSLLARLVIDEAFHGEQLDNSGTPYMLPSPVRILWRHPVTQLPLYAANQFEPVTADSEVSIWWHKRFIRVEHVAAGKHVKRSDIDASAGRFKEKRIPLPAHIASTWRADCIGNVDEIARLLEKCYAISKKRMASVIEWRISKLPAFEFNRPVPVEYVARDGVDLQMNMRFCGWTPPYWSSVPECQGWCKT